MDLVESAWGTRQCFHYRWRAPAGHWDPFTLSHTRLHGFKYRKGNR
jgi:hypothetical protein